MPGGPHKKELLENLDRVPTYVQQLQFTVKNPTVGKAATFTKVDNVIQETKNLMNVISKVVTTCFVCATKVSKEHILHARSFYTLNKQTYAFTRISFAKYWTNPYDLKIRKVDFSRDILIIYLYKIKFYTHLKIIYNLRILILQLRDYVKFSRSILCEYLIHWNAC